MIEVLLSVDRGSPSQLILCIKMATKKTGGTTTTARAQVVFLFDVDNTLLDNDRVTADLRRYLEREVGLKRAQSYWSIFERLRAELDYADYLGALQRYRAEYPHDLRLLTVSRFLINYPFANRLYPNSLDAVDACEAMGRRRLAQRWRRGFPAPQSRALGAFRGGRWQRIDLCA